LVLDMKDVLCHAVSYALVPMTIRRVCGKFPEVNPRERIMK
jgi:hypothetical protein